MFYKKAALKILQSSQENSYVGDAFTEVFLLKFITKETLTQMFSSQFYNIFENSFLIEHLKWLLLKLRTIFRKRTTKTYENFFTYWNLKFKIIKKQTLAIKSLDHEHNDVTQAKCLKTMIIDFPRKIEKI